jgi:putative molybdopterin biosynthesis protein
MADKPANSPFIRDVPAPQALDAWRAARRAAGCPPRLPAVTVPVAEAAGLVTAAPVWAVRSSPPFDAAGMDGIAVRSADTLGASETTPLWLGPAVYDIVDTGDPMPDGRDAVVMREHVHYDDAGRAELRAAVPPYQHVRSIGEDVSAGELLLATGHRLRPVDVAAAAAAGATALSVRQKALVLILPTGDEVRPIGTATGPGEILDTNSLMLAEQAREAGCQARCLPIEPDDPERIAAAVRAAAAQCDLLIVIAGSSAGRDDYTARVVASAGTLAVHGVAVRPGHPVVLGVVGQTPVLGAPGYPVSAALTFDIFAAPLLAELSGAPPRQRPRTSARLARKLASPLGMDDWVRVRLGSVGGSLVATPLPRGAGVLTSLVRADGLLVVPAGAEGHHAGSCVPVDLLRGLDEIARTIVAIGSHDMVLDLASSFLRADDPMVTLASSNVGSLGGLVALRDGLCHIAGSHLLDPASGHYTLPYVDRVFGAAAGEVAVVRLVERSQGLMVAAGNPLGICGLPDVCRPGVRYVNRQRGAGTRVLLDVMLGRQDLAAASIEGYAREEPTHLAVAAAIASGRADAGLGIMAAAQAFGLGFVPLATEPYDLAVAPGAFASPQLAPLWTLLRSDDFKAAVEELGGYSAREMGRRVRLMARGLPGAARGDHPGLVGEDDQLRPVVRAELHHRPADVRLGRGGAEHQGVGDLVVGQPVRDQGHHLAFPVGQGFHARRGHRIRRPGDELADQAAGDGRGQERVPAHDDPQRLQQLGRLGVLQQEPARACPQRAEDVLVELEVGQDHDAHAVQPLVRDDLPGGLDTVKHRHLNVHERDVRAVLGGQRHRLPPVDGLGDHLDVIFRLEQRPDTAADQRLVVSQQDPDQDGARTGSSARTWKPPPSCGPVWSRPPSADTRSRMPARPSPGPDGRVPALVPWPSSSTWTQKASGE